MKIYTANIKTQQNEERQEVIIDDILKELDKGKTMVINKKIPIQRWSIDVCTRRKKLLIIFFM